MTDQKGWERALGEWWCEDKKVPGKCIHGMNHDLEDCLHCTTEFLIHYAAERVRTHMDRCAECRKCHYISAGCAARDVEA